MGNLLRIVRWPMVTAMAVVAAGCESPEPVVVTPASLCDRSGNCYALHPPADPQCYSPCTESVALASGGLRECAADGLLPGCLGAATCQSGSCIGAGSPGNYPSCNRDTDCPDHQVCLSGQCYSNCEVDGDCPGDGAFGCHRRTCRLPCDTAGAGCGEDTYCLTVDGENGFCVPLAEASGDHSQVAGTFSVSSEGFEYSNLKCNGTFIITNDSPIGLDFTIRKIEHTEYTEYTDAGFIVVREDPLHWIRIGLLGDVSPVQEFTVFVEGDGGTATIALLGAENPVLNSWSGVMEVSNPELGVRHINLRYVERPDGQWSGGILYFASFPDKGVDAWRADPDNLTLLEEVENAFIQRWVAMKEGFLTYDEFQAMLLATQNGSWKWPAIREQYARCENPFVACYLYDNPNGFMVYSNDLTRYPIPSGVSELQMAVNLISDPDDSTLITGRIISDESMHYAGEPALRIRLAEDPARCSLPIAGAQICPVVSLDASISVGGRYRTSATDSDCALAAPGTFELTRTPWLIPGFSEGVEVDVATGRRYTYECRDTLLPYGDEATAANVSFAASNPIPDGRTRQRSLELIDGMLINQETLLLLVREHFDSFLGETDQEGFSAYGLVQLSRVAANVAAEDFVGSEITDSRMQPTGALGVSCSAEILDAALDGAALGPATADALAPVLIDGLKSSGTAVELPASEVHYYCEDTGLIDGGADDTGPAGAKVPCPVGSRVRFFTTSLSQTQLAALPCQQGFTTSDDGEITGRGNCQQTLNQWSFNEINDLVYDPVWRCQDPTLAYCDQNRRDLRSGKTFYEPGDPIATFLPLRTQVDDAFRYKTRFRNRSGKSVGFAPELCIPDSSEIPYCYDPPSIEAARARVDCAVGLYLDHYGDLSTENRALLQKYLITNFGFEQEIVAPELPPVIHDGFERLYAELLIMMGDEAYTNAFASRFDLAGSNLRSFEGSLFEPGGIDLSGGAGFEMYNLYQGAQYYQAALDRFYSLSPLLWRSIDELGAANGFVTVDTVVTYFDRLIRASSQKSRTWSEVARRYQGFNRPDLSRLVVSRAYTAAYLESIILSRMMLKLEGVVQPEDRPQLVQRVENAQLVYRSALLRMQDTFEGITDDPTLFGFAPDYIPFPALDAGDTNAFDKVFASALSKLETAGVKEQEALAGTREFDTDAALFQSELIQIRNNYEGQLGEICGTFEGDDGNIYPAIPKYAPLNRRAALLGNPCGTVDNGELWSAKLDVELGLAALKGARLQYADLFSRVDLERQRVARQCELIEETAQYEYDLGVKVSSLNASISISERILDEMNTLEDDVRTIAQLQKCSIIVGTSGGGDCPTAAAAAAGFFSAKTAIKATKIGLKLNIEASQIAIDALETQAGKWITERECDYAKAESNFAIRDMLLDLKHLDLDVLSASLELQQKVGTVVQLIRSADGLIAEQEESEQLTINVEAARNDPNVRIYKNDAILSADRTFRSALREAYRATKVYEYYTSQTYGFAGDLFLIRMVGYGDISLESYLADLEDAFVLFEEQFGNPDLRVEILSLRDDVLAIDRIDTGGQPLSEADRMARLREKLTDPSRLDARGYLSIPFSTSIAQLSPVTRTHKLVAVEAEVIGADVGDTLGRVYLRQRGTGMVRSVDDSKIFYLFPERTAVVNTFFNGERVFDTSVYRNSRLRDRPFVNSHWELVLNQRDEGVNKDINLESLSDIRLYLYYSDFTEL